MAVTDKVFKAFARLGRAIRYYAVGLYQRLDEHHAFLMSGGLAFSLFVCAVPLLLVVFSVLSNFLERPTVAAEISEYVNRVVPYPEYAQALNDFISQRLTRLAEVKRVAGLIGIVGLVFASSGLFSSLRTILNTVFRTAKIESVLVGKLYDFGLIIIVLTLFVVLNLALPAVEAMSELAGEAAWLDWMGLDMTYNVIVGLISLVAILGTFSIIYWLVPVRKPGGVTIFVGALAASFLWLLAKELFGYYVSHMATLRHIYGVYTFLIVAAFWIYYSALALIIGAEVGQLFTERRNHLANGENRNSS
jgi:membrane protein